MGCGTSKSRIDTLIAQAVEADHRGRKQQSGFNLEETENSDVDQLSTKPKSSLTVTLRSTTDTLPASSLTNDHNTIARRSLDEVLPAADDQITKRGKSISIVGPVGWGIWKTSKERRDFITATLIVLSGNGYRNISQRRITLFIPRIGTDHTAYRAGLAIMYDPDDSSPSDAMVSHAIVARRYAVDQKSAFMELMLDIEEMLASHLHNGEVHISRYGMGAGQNEVAKQSRIRTIRRVETPLIPSDAAQAMNGLSEPYTYNRSVVALPPSTREGSSDYGGFVVGEVESKKSTSSCRTTGGFGAMPYNSWMQPMPSRARQMHSHVLARPSLSSMNSLRTVRSSQSQQLHGVDRISAQPQKHNHNGIGASVPAGRPDDIHMPPPVSSASTTSDPIPSPSSDPRTESSHSSIQLLQPIPIAGIPSAPDVNIAFSARSGTSSGTPAETESDPIASVPFVREPVPTNRRRRNSIAGPPSSHRQPSHSSGKLLRYRSTMATPHPEKLQYYGLDRLEEDSDETKLFS